MTYAFTRIAESGRRFADFAPYVPSINGLGQVAFQASLPGGGSGIFLGDGDSVTELASSGDLLRDVTSHPDINDDGTFCAYAELCSGANAVVLGRAGSLTVLADTRGVLTSIGPLGPTMNEAGAVAFRASTQAGHPGIFKAHGRSITPIAGADRLAAAHGLPVIDDRGTVIFRADLADGTQGIYAGDEDALAPLVDTTSTFAALSRFPCVNGAGTVAFGATRKDGGPGVFTVSGHGVTAVIDSAGRFESVRGALLDDAGSVVFFATPRGGSLGIYDGAAQRILGLGDPAFGSTVVDFALNPVSINRAGQLAIRVALANGGQLIVRADPPRASATTRGVGRHAPG